MTTVILDLNLIVDVEAAQLRHTVAHVGTDGLGGRVAACEAKTALGELIPLTHGLCRTSPITAD